MSWSPPRPCTGGARPATGCRSCPSTAHGRFQVATPSAFVDDGRRAGLRGHAPASAGWCAPPPPIRSSPTRAGGRWPSWPSAPASPWPPACPTSATSRCPAARCCCWPTTSATAGCGAREEQRRDEAVQRCRSMDLDGLALLRRHGLFHADDRTVALPAGRHPPAPRAAAALPRAAAGGQPPGPARAASAGSRSWPAPSALVRSVQHLLLRFGVVTSLHAVRDQHRGAERTVHALVVEPASAHAVDVDAAARLGVPVRALVAAGRAPGRGRAPAATPPAEPPREAGRPDVCWDEIVAITTEGDEQVYDLTVPGLANFVAADVVVHNTAFALGIATHVAVEAAPAGAVLLAGDGPRRADAAHPVGRGPGRLAEDAHRAACPSRTGRRSAGPSAGSRRRCSSTTTRTSR